MRRRTRVHSWWPFFVPPLLLGLVLLALPAARTGGITLIALAGVSCAADLKRFVIDGLRRKR
jgi:hypothetical protein